MVEAVPDLVASLTDPDELETAPRAVIEAADILEVRADLTGDVDPDWLRQRFEGRLLYTLRSRHEGGSNEDSSRDRALRLRDAVSAYDLVDLEADRDLDSQTLKAIPPDQRLLSWHGGVATRAELGAKLDHMAGTPAVYRKLIPSCRRAGQELAVVELLLERQDGTLMAFCTGVMATWTRLVAVRLGSPLLYASLASRPAAPGQPSLERVLSDYDLAAIRSCERLFGIVGDPVDHSLSPRLHNRSYRRLGLHALYLPFHVEQFGDFWLEVVENELFDRLGAPLCGLSITTPWKEAALAVAGASSPRAQALGGANTLVRRRGVWEAESTDPEGVRIPLERRGVDLEVPAAVVGCGAAGRAAALGLARAGADVSLFNRRRERGEEAARRLELPYYPLDMLDPGEFSIVVQATSLGHRADDPAPFDVDATRPDATIIELVYDREPTRVERRAGELGRTLISGREVLLGQALEQFRLMTGATLSLDDGAAALGLDLSEAITSSDALGEPQ